MTTFWYQSAAERTLRQAARLGRLSRSFLFVGPEGAGKWAAAVWVAQALLCRQKHDGEPCGACRDCARVKAYTHPDLHLLFPLPGGRSQDDDDKPAEVKVDEHFKEFMTSKRADPFTVVRFKRKPLIKMSVIRALLAELHLTSVEGGAKVVIIQSAEQTKDNDTQSVMLKTIEEPPPDAHFILTSSAPERLLPTIHSRCQTVRFTPVDPDVIAGRLTAELGVDPVRAREVADLSGGGWGTASRLAADEHREWHALMMEFWNGAFRARPHEMLAQIEPTFRKGKTSVGFDALLQAFDVWGYCLWRDCFKLAEDNTGTSHGAPIPDLETGWACWRILQSGRSSLYVNVGDRQTVAATFLAMRRRLRM